MKYFKSFTGLLLVAGIILGMGTELSHAQKKRAQTSMKFLSTSMNARASGMASAYTSIETQAQAMFYNPSTMARMDGSVSASGGMIQWIADINYNAGAIAFKPFKGKYGVFGFNLVSVDYGDIMRTVVSDNEQGYEEVGTFSPNALSIGMGYARAITNQFSVGGNVKYVYQDLGSVGSSPAEAGGYNTKGYTAGVVAVDFGVHYNTNWNSLNFAMSVRNFSPEVSFYEEASELPLTFRIGLSMDVINLTDLNNDMHKLMVSVDANRPRDYYEQILLGVEYTFMDRFILRGGVVTPHDQRTFSAGAGIIQPIGDLNMEVHYAYTPFDIFTNVNQLTVQFDI